MGLLDTNIFSSQFTKAERWLKLYRTIHHLYLKEEFIHRGDYNKMVSEMNARITELEAKISAELTKINLGLTLHTHVTNTPGQLTSPPAAPIPVYLPGLTPTKPVVPVTTAMESADSLLMSTGPAKAPLASGITSQELNANTTIVSDIGT